MTTFPKMPNYRLPTELLNRAAFDMDSMVENIRDARNRSKHLVNDIIQRIKAFESALDADHEVGLRLVSFGYSEVFHVDSITNIEPDALVFRGTNADGHPVELIQHITQTNMLLVAAKKRQSTKNPIGFVPLNPDANENQK